WWLSPFFLEKRSPEERRLLLTYIFSNLFLKDKKATNLLKSSPQKLAQRVQERIDAQNKFELRQKTSESFVSKGNLSMASSNHSLRASEAQKNIRTSKSPLVKARQRQNAPLSRSWLRG
ncbi:MAG: hypothetical protein AAB863_00675, partial [Patescibacteria group bacterium]